MAQTIKAKFKCTEITYNPSVNDDRKVKFEAVTDGSEENKSFAKYTPNGQLSMSISPETTAFDFFLEGKEYCLNISEA